MDSPLLPFMTWEDAQHTSEALVELREYREATWCRACCPVPVQQVKCIVRPPRSGITAIGIWGVKGGTPIPIDDIITAIENAEYRLVTIVGNEEEGFVVANVHIMDGMELRTDPDAREENNLLNVGTCNIVGQRRP